MKRTTPGDRPTETGKTRRTKRTAVTQAATLAAPPDIPGWTAYAGAAAAAMLPFAAALPVLTYHFLGSYQTDLNLQYRHFIGFAVRWLQQGVLPCWNPHTFCGGPFLPNTSATIFSPSCAPLLLALAQPLSINLVILTHCVLLAAGAVWWARSRGLSYTAALMSGVLAACSSVMPCRVFAGHYTIITTLAWFPWVLGLHDRHLNGRQVPAAVFGALCALMFFGGHIQYAYYTFLLLSVNLLIAGLRGARWRAPGWLRTQVIFHLTAGAVAVLIAGIELLPLADTMRYSARAGVKGVEWLRFFSMPPENYLSLLAPQFLGSGTEYWGRWYWWETTTYMTWTGLALVVAAAVGAGDRRPARLMILSGMTVLLGSAGFLPGLREVVGLIPVWEFFRGHAKILGPGLIIAAVVAAHGYDALRRSPDRRPNIGPICAIVALGLLCIVMIAASNHLVPAWFLRSDDRMALTDSPDAPLRSLALSTWNRAFALAAVWAFLVCAWLVARPRLTAGIWSACGLILALADGLFFAVPHASATFSPARDQPLAEVASYLRGQNKPARAEFPGVFLAADPVTAGFETLGGHDINVTKYFSTFAAAVLGDPPGWPYLNFVADRESPLLDAANVGFWVLPRPEEASGLVRAGLQPAGSAGGLTILRRPRALPRAYVTGTARFIKDDEQAVWQALVGMPDFHRGVILTGSPADKVPDEDFPPVEAPVNSQGLHRTAVTAPRDGWLVLADGYSPRWQAAIRGEPVKVFRANGLFRAVRVRAGDEVVFSLDRKPLAAGSLMSAAGLIWLTVALVRGRRRGITENPGATPANHAEGTSGARDIHNP